MYCYKEFIFLASVSPTDVERLENGLWKLHLCHQSLCQLGLSPQAV